VIRHALAMPEHTHPEAPPRRETPPGLGPLVDLLRVLLKLKCEEHGVAQKLVASAEDLELIAAEDTAEVQALVGWRRELFGEDALALTHGHLALTAAGKQIRLGRLDEPTPVEAHGSV